jgi:predicted RecA/RadA family phage recombinase
MSTTYVKRGDVLTLTAPTGGVTIGAPIFVANVFCIPKTTVAQTLSFDADVSGVHSLTKVGSQAWSEGDRIYWDVANTRCSSDATVGALIGSG